MSKKKKNKKQRKSLYTEIIVINIDKAKEIIDDWANKLIQEATK